MYLKKGWSSFALQINENLKLKLTRKEDGTVVSCCSIEGRFVSFYPTTFEEKEIVRNSFATQPLQRTRTFATYIPIAVRRLHPEWNEAQHQKKLKVNLDRRVSIPVQKLLPARP
jgi:hypothetical protein